MLIFVFLQIMGVTFLAFTVAHVVATTINPADLAVIEKNRQVRQPVMTLDRSRHKHAIEDQFCNLCQVGV